MFAALRRRLFGDDRATIQKLKSENAKLNESVAQLTQEKASAVQNLEKMRKAAKEQKRSIESFEEAVKKLEDDATTCEEVEKRLETVEAMNSENEAELKRMIVEYKRTLKSLDEAKKIKINKSYSKAASERERASMEVIKRLKKNEERLKAELKRMSTVVAKQKKRPYENGRSFDVHNATYSGTIEPGRSCRINIKHVDVHPQGRATLTLHFPDRSPVSLIFRGNGGLQFFDGTPERQLRDRMRRWGKNTRLNLYGGVLQVQCLEDRGTNTWVFTIRHATRWTLSEYGQWRGLRGVTVRVA